MTCVWEIQDEEEGVYASPMGEPGHIYLVGRNDASSVLKPSDRFEVLAVNTLDDKIDVRIDLVCEIWGRMLQ